MTRTRRRLWLAGWTLLAVLNLAAGVVISSWPERQNDLATIHRWGRAWLVNGSNVYQLDELVDYPPHAIVALSPLGVLPATVSVPIWTSLNLALSVLAVYLAVRAARPSRRSRPTRSVFGDSDTLLAMAMFLCWGGFRTLLQFSLLTLTLGLAAIVLADRRPARSGICLGLSLMKPQIAIPFVLWAVFTRRLRVLIVAATVVVGGFLVYCLGAWVSPVAVVVRYTEILGISYWDPTTDLVGLAQARPLVALVMSRPGSVNALFAALSLALLAGICASGYLEGRDRPTLMFSAPALAGVWSLMTFYHLTYGFILLLPVATLLLWADDPGSQALRARMFWVLQAGLMCDVPGLWRRFGVPLHLPSIVDAGMGHADRVLIVVLFAALTTLGLRNLSPGNPQPNARSARCKALGILAIYALMPIRYVVDRIARRMVTHADGLVTFQDLSRHLDDEERDHGLELPELFDARGATTNVTPEEVRTLVQRAGDTLRRIPLGPTAIVATNDVVFGMARMYAILGEQAGAKVEVFRDVEAAKRWLQEAT